METATATKTGTSVLCLFDKSGNHASHCVEIVGTSRRAARDAFHKWVREVSKYADATDASAYVYYRAFVDERFGQPDYGPGYPEPYPDGEFTVGPKGGYRFEAC